MKMRAVFITNDEDMGGPSRVCTRIFEAVATECEAHLIVQGKNAVDSAHNPRVHAAVGFLQFIRLLMALSRSEPKTKSTFFAFGTKQSLYLLVFRFFTFDRRNKYVVRTGLNPIGSSVKKESFFKNHLQQRWCNIAYRFYDVIVTETSRVRDFWSCSFNGKKQIVFIPNPVREFAHSDKIDGLESEFKQKTVFLAVGRLSYQKNFAFLIKCFSMLDPELVRNCRLVILGEGPERVELERQIERLGLSDYVSLRGFVENVDDYLQRCDVFCLTSRWEGGANSLIEAVCFTKRIIAVDCPIGPAEILRDYHYGTLVDSEAVSAFTQAMKESCFLDSPQPNSIHSSQYRMSNIQQRYLDLMVGQ